MNQMNEQEMIDMVKDRNKGNKMSFENSFVIEENFVWARIIFLPLFELNKHYVLCLCKFFKYHWTMKNDYISENPA